MDKFRVFYVNNFFKTKTIKQLKNKHIQAYNIICYIKTGQNMVFQALHLCHNYDHNFCPYYVQKAEKLASLCPSFAKIFCQGSNDSIFKVIFL